MEYQGDINSPALSTSERCRIKRRIVNREAARRLRERRQETLDSAQDKVSHLRKVHHAVLWCDVLPWLLTYLVPACSAWIGTKLCMSTGPGLPLRDVVQP